MNRQIIHIYTSRSYTKKQIRVLCTGRKIDAVLSSGEWEYNTPPLNGTTVGAAATCLGCLKVYIKLHEAKPEKVKARLRHLREGINPDTWVERAFGGNGSDEKA